MPLTVLSVSYSLAQVSPRTAGGAEQVLSTLDRALVRAGHRSLVLAPAGSRCHGLLVPVQIPSGILDERAKREARRIFKHSLDRALEEHPFDIVHMHGLDFAEYLPTQEIPVVVSLHLPLSWYAPEVLRLTRPDVMLVCVSESQARTAPADVAIDRVIQNGIDIERFHPVGRKGNYVVAIGRICPEKGFHLAIEAAERAGTKLILAGSIFDYPEHREYFDSKIHPKLNSNIRFVGPVGGVRKAQLLAGARCLLLPTLAPETSSLSAMEAMASGTPVIAFRRGALQEIIAEQRTGFLVESVEEMAEAITRVDDIAPESCRREAERRFSSDRMFAQYMDLYGSVLAYNSIPELQAA